MKNINIHTCVIADITYFLIFITLYCGIVAPYVMEDLGKRWLRYNGWYVAWQYQANTWTNVDLSIYHQWALGPVACTRRQLVLMISFIKLVFKNYTFKITFMSARWQWVNSWWPTDIIWWHRSGSTLAQVMACFLTAPSHYQNFCSTHLKLISQEVLNSSICKTFEKCTCKID